MALQLKELDSKEVLENGKVRKKGGGPKFVEEKCPGIQKYIEAIVDTSTYGDPERVLTWTTESLRSIQRTLTEEYNIKTGHVTIGVILESLWVIASSLIKSGLCCGEVHLTIIKSIC